MNVGRTYDNPSPFYGGSFHIVEDAHGELYEVQVWVRSSPPAGSTSSLYRWYDCLSSFYPVYSEQPSRMFTLDEQFHHQVSFRKSYLAKFNVIEFPRQLFQKEYREEWV